MTPRQIAGAMPLLLAVVVSAWLAWQRWQHMDETSLRFVVTFWRESVVSWVLWYGGAWLLLGGGSKR